jgi:hypothetical protein
VSSDARASAAAADEKAKEQAALATAATEFKDPSQCVPGEPLPQAGKALIYLYSDIPMLGAETAVVHPTCAASGHELVGEPSWKHRKVSYVIYEVHATETTNVNLEETLHIGSRLADCSAAAEDSRGRITAEWCTRIPGGDVTKTLLQIGVRPGQSYYVRIEFSELGVASSAKLRPESTGAEELKALDQWSAW